MTVSSSLIHPIQAQSFAIIDQEIGPHSWSPAEYEIIRRVIHSTADFEFTQLMAWSPTAIESGIDALRHRVPIITDVGMVAQGIRRLVGQTFKNPIICALEQVPAPLPGKTWTETGMWQCWQKFPTAIFVIGNAPTALLALCQGIQETLILPAPLLPSLIIGVPVGFVSVVESKATLAQVPVPQIRVEGRKGGSAVAAAILNALIILAWEREMAENRH